MSKEQLQDILECPICMEQFQTPKQLQCQHVVCLKCLQGIYASARGSRVRCPECRQEYPVPTNGIAGFPTSLAIQRLIEAINMPTQQARQPQPSAPPERDAFSTGEAYVTDQAVRYLLTDLYLSIEPTRGSSEDHYNGTGNDFVDSDRRDSEVLAERSPDYRNYEIRKNLEISNLGYQHNGTGNNNGPNTGMARGYGTYRQVTNTRTDRSTSCCTLL